MRGPARPALDIQARASLLLALLLISIPALHQGLGATRGLHWPPDNDHYRDVAAAQTMSDGYPEADPFYRGETIWYNPLVPLVVAGASKVSGLPIPATHARLGAWLNLLAPVAFFFAVAALFGHPAAAAATFHLVFLRDASDPPWLSPSYSPWLFPSLSATGLFYLTLLAYACALRNGARRWTLASGLLLGLTFLAHTAPALVLGFVVLAGVVREALRDPRRALRLHALLLGSALAVSAPFLASILGRYRLHVLNSAPLAWLWPPLAPERIATFFVTHVSLASALALLALAGLGRRRAGSLETCLALAWTAGAALWVGYGVLAESVPGLPRVLPLHHFLVYLRSAESALAGYGLALVLGTLVRGRRVDLLIPLALALGIVWVWPDYVQRDAFVSARRQAEREEEKLNREEAREWIRARTLPRDVFLAPDDLALLVVGAAGRKTVALDPYFANPYVDARPRREARDAMLAALEGGQSDAFAALGSRFGVTYVIRKKSDGPPLDDAPGLFREFANARIRIYRVIPWCYFWYSFWNE